MRIRLQKKYLKKLVDKGTCNTGFTLFETLVAIFVTVLLSTALYFCFSSGIKFCLRIKNQNKIEILSYKADYFFRNTFGKVKIPLWEQTCEVKVEPASNMATGGVLHIQWLSGESGSTAVSVPSYIEDCSIEVIKTKNKKPIGVKARYYINADNSMESKKSCECLVPFSSFPYGFEEIK